MSNIEQTLSIIKPDAVERNLENEIKEMFKNTGFNIHKQNNSIRFMRQSHFIMIYVHIYHLDQL